MNLGYLYYIEKKKYNIIHAKLNSMSKFDIKETIRTLSVPTLLASMCCLSPVILFSFGLVSLSVASELADVFYGQYKWVFRGVGILALFVMFFFYLRRSGVCTLDDAKKRRNEILNKLFLFLALGALAYIFFLYVVVHYIGVWQGLWK